MARFKRAEDIKAGVIGYGGAFNMGKAHLTEMKGAGMTPLAVAEIDTERLKVASNDFPGIETYSSVAAMLTKSDVNVVTIITPHNTHAKLALECLRAGKHVVCEKPLAIATAECDAMIVAARKRKLVLSTYHNRHWDGWILRAVKEIGGGVIGDVVRIEAHMGGWGKPGDWWRSSKSISGGILYDWGVHLLEYALQILGDARLTEVSGFAKSGFWASHTAWKKDTNEDEALAIARFDTGQWLALSMSSIECNPKPGMLEITGTKGTYIFDWNNWKTIQREGDATVTRTGPNPQSEGWKFYKNIAAHLVRNEKLVITPEWARRPIHILDLACRSAKQGAALKAKYA